MNGESDVHDNQNEAIAETVQSESDNVISSANEFDNQIVQQTSRVSFGRIIMKSNLDIYLTYRIITPNATAAARQSFQHRSKIMDIDHVHVPIELRGCRLAESLAKEAFSLSKTKGWMIRPTCSYIRETFLIRNPGYNDIIIGDDIVDTTKSLRKTPNRNHEPIVSHLRKRKLTQSNITN